ncbi:hypothetical protein [Actinacidiphila glaucinigra]
MEAVSAAIGIAVVVLGLGLRFFERAAGSDRPSAGPAPAPAVAPGPAAVVDPAGPVAEADGAAPVALEAPKDRPGPAVPAERRPVDGEG